MPKAGADPTPQAQVADNSVAVEPSARLTKDFDRAMRGVYDRARTEAGYSATYFLSMLAEHGGMGTARKLLQSPAVSDGFRALWERGRLDLTAEALVLRDDFADLFTDDEIELARRRLSEFGFYA